MTNTHVAQPAIGAISAGLLGLLHRWGIRPQMAAGQQLRRTDRTLCRRCARLPGLHRAGRAPGPRHGPVHRGRRHGRGPRFPDAEVERLLAELPQVVFAGHNAPNQCTITGEISELRAAGERLQAAHIRMDMLPVSGLVPLAAHAAVALIRWTAHTGPRRGRRCASRSTPTGGVIYAGGAAATRADLAGHLLQPVDFVGQVEKMVADGADLFVEVGPRTILSDLTCRIVADPAIPVLALDVGWAAGCAVCSRRWPSWICSGVPCAPVQLSSPRAPVTRRPGQPGRDQPAPLPHSPTTMLTNGVTIRRPDATSRISCWAGASLREFVKDTLW
ncbi:MAG: hypothetical protein R2838_04035 [Caldilineaceae bacterium]